MTTWDVPYDQLMGEKSPSRGAHGGVSSACSGKLTLNAATPTLPRGETLKTTRREILAVDVAARSTPCHEPGVVGGVT